MEVTKLSGREFMMLMHSWMTRLRWWKGSAEVPIALLRAVLSKPIIVSVNPFSHEHVGFVKWNSGEKYVNLDLTSLKSMFETNLLSNLIVRISRQHFVHNCPHFATGKS